MEAKTIPHYQNDLQGLRTQLKAMLPQDALAVFDKDAQAMDTQYKSILKLGEGDMAPDFSLSNATGDMVRLNDLLKKGPVVLTFYRGTWCPYCNLQLAQLQGILPQIKGIGASLVAVSPQTPDNSLDIKEKNNLEFEVLSDVGNIVARQFTTVFKYGETPLNTMKELGYDFDSFYGDDSREIPIPALFIINQDSKVIYAKSEGGDYRNRVEPAEILIALGA